MNFIIVIRQYTVNGMTYQRQNSFLEDLVYVIIHKLVLWIYGIVRFLTIRQYTFLDKPHMRQ